MLEAVLFDLDGTVADTAPDLGAAANRLRQEAGLTPLPLAALRPYTSQGVRGLLRVAFATAPGEEGYEALAARFLELYAADICVHTTLFDGIAELLDRLDATGVPWGIVTNKRSRFTLPLLERLGLASRTPCVVSGDTTAATKPSPLPVLHACSLLSVAPGKVLYVGDDLRDIQSGRAAGTLTAAVSYGYLGDCPPLDEWNAHFVAGHPRELAGFIFG